MRDLMLLQRHYLSNMLDNGRECQNSRHVQQGVSLVIAVYIDGWRRFHVAGSIDFLTDNTTFIAFLDAASLYLMTHFRTTLARNIVDTGLLLDDFSPQDACKISAIYHRGGAGGSHMNMDARDITAAHRSENLFVDAQKLHLQKPDAPAYL